MIFPLHLPPVYSYNPLTVRYETSVDRKER